MTWWITDTSIGQRLKFVRRFRRLTQKELGLLMGYSEKTADVRIAQYEKNARTPNAETTAKLAEVLKVSPAVFQYCMSLFRNAFRRLSLLEGSSLIPSTIRTRSRHCIGYDLLSLS